ncbi:MAG: (4Fe-4S)-binding protein [Lewinella sp.]|uniref:(4Fe-4S)-binding protein n=1 Tax=Lewinella sp. TaxID=2004506 RepID=UPI003D6C4DBA
MPDKNITKEYSNGEITIVWKPALCAHSEKCWNKNKGGLPSVLDPQKRPWINPEGASSKLTMQHIDRCPSGALSYFNNDDQNQNTANTAAVTPITVSPNGPLIIKGQIIIEHLDGRQEQLAKTALCRCGASQNKPFCDGSHHKINFQDA